MSRYAKLIGVGANLPSRKVTNDHFASYLDTSDEWIRSRTGIVSRYLASDEDTLTSLALPAVKQALEHAGKTAADLDLIIVATTTPERIHPASACLLQAELGASGSAFDIQAVCSGFVYALGVANAMISSGQANCAAVVGADTFSRLLDWNDRSTCILFGDGAGAVILTNDNEPGIIAVEMGANGAQADALSAAGHVENGKLVNASTTKMDGAQVYKFAVRMMREASLKVCQQAGITTDKIDWFVPHQANIRIINDVAKRLQLTDEKVVKTVVEHGNTSAASIPLGLSSIVDKLKPNQHLLLATAGGGFTWGAALLKI